MNLNQVTLLVSDLDKSIEFYKNLGHTLIVYSSENSYARFECPAFPADAPPASFSLHGADNIAFTTTKHYSPASLYFECEDVVEQHKKLTAKGVEFITPPTEQSWGWHEAWLHDPDKHAICIYHAGGNRLNPPWRI